MDELLASFLEALNKKTLFITKFTLFFIQRFIPRVEGENHRLEVNCDLVAKQSTNYVDFPSFSICLETRLMGTN